MMFTPSSHHNNFFSGAYAHKVRVLLFLIYFRTVTGFPRTCDFSRTVWPLARRSSSARDCNVNASTIALSAVYCLQFLPLFGRSGLHACDVSLSVPTSGGFYTSSLSLQCSHTTESDVILGFDWMSSCGVALSDDRCEPVDPSHVVVMSL